MRKGNESKLILNKQGQIIGFATGSDFCSEHEQGSKPLLSALCEQYAQEADTLQQLQKQLAAKKGGILRKLLAGNAEVQYPNLFEAKRITKLPDGLQFKVCEGDTPEAILGFARYSIDYFKDSELRFPSYVGKDGDKDVAGAWDEESFAIRVRGAKYVAMLKEFYEGLQAKRAVFAGTFVADHRCNGVIMALEDRMTDEMKAAAVAAQAQYESKLRLKACDDSSEVLAEMRKAYGSDRFWPGFLWVVWKDAEESEVLYGLNPMSVDADYLGPYTRDQLLTWAKAKCDYRLTQSSEPQPA